VRTSAPQVVRTFALMSVQTVVRTLVQTHTSTLVPKTNTRNKKLINGIAATKH
jgi:hypothetical protein